MGGPEDSRRRRSRTVLRVVVVLGVSSALAVSVILGGGDDLTPTAEPEVVLPPDIGRDWDVDGTSQTRLDLDGDGDDERIRLRYDPEGSYDDRRVRLETELTGGGSAYGVVEYDWIFDETPDSDDPLAGAVDADGDGDQELVLTDSQEQAYTPRVLDLTDGMMVEAPPAETADAVLRRGSLGVDGGTEDYDLVRYTDWEIKGGALRSGTSGRVFAEGAGSYEPSSWIADTWTWRLDAAGVLQPVPGPRACGGASDLAPAPCPGGRTEGLPGLGPVADGSVGAGESFEEADDPVALAALSVTVRGASAGVVLDVERDGEAVEVALPDPSTRVSTRLVTGLFGEATAGLALDVDGDRQPDGVVLIGSASDGTVAAEVVGPPAGTDGAPTWLDRRGSIYSLVGGEASAGNRSGDLVGWKTTEDGDGLFAFPYGPVCLPTGSPHSAERC